MSKKLQQYIWQLKLWNKKRKLLTIFYGFSFLKFFLPKKKPINDLSFVKKILIVRNDKLGDLIVTTGFIRELAKAGYEVYVSSERESLNIVKYDPNVKDVFIYQDNTLRQLYRSIKKIRREQFDAVIDLKFCRNVYKKNIFFCSFVKSPLLIGFNKSNIGSYNISLPYYESSAHVTTRLPLLLKLFNIQDYDLKYEIFTPQAIQDNVTSFVTESLDTNKKIAVVNPLGGNRSRWLTQAQLDQTLALLMPHYQIVMIGQASQLQNFSWPESIPLFPSNNILEVVPLIEKADLIFTVDTSIVHIASAFSNKTIALYLDLTHGKSPNPFRQAYQIKVAEYGAHLLNSLADGPYLKNNNCDESIPINHLNWSPNNPNAEQVIFPYRSFSDIPSDEFLSTITTVLKEY